MGGMLIGAQCLWLRSSRKPQQDAFSTLLLCVLLGTACSLTLGAILSIWVAPETILVVVLSASAYRGWLVWEWGTIVRDTMEKPRLLLCMMMQVAVLGITCVAFGIRLAEPGLASTYTEMLVSSREEYFGAGTNEVDHLLWLCVT